jgi:hypothetical protein
VDASGWRLEQVGTRSTFITLASGLDWRLDSGLNSGIERQLGSGLYISLVELSKLLLVGELCLGLCQAERWN